jgi:hypothetical protein
LKAEEPVLSRAQLRGYRVHLNAQVSQTGCWVVPFAVCFRDTQLAACLVKSGQCLSALRRVWSTSNDEVVQIMEHVEHFGANALLQGICNCMKKHFGSLNGSIGSPTVPFNSQSCGLTGMRQYADSTSILASRAPCG